MADDQIERKPQKSCVIHEALVGKYVCKISAVGGDKYGANATEDSRNSREIDYGLLDSAVLAKGYEKNRENQQTAKMKGKSARVKNTAAFWAFYHIAHNFTCLAYSADNAHNISRKLEREIFYFADIGEQNDENDAKPYSNEMLCGKHCAYPPAWCFF